MKVSETRIPEWVPNSKYRPPKSPHASRIVNKLDGADQIVAVSTPLLGYAEFGRAMEFHMHRDSPRCYVLTSPANYNHPNRKLSDEKVHHHESALKSLREAALIRTPNRFRSSIVLFRSGRDKSGLFFTGNMGSVRPESGHELLVELNSAEASDLLSLFCWIFWEGAAREYIGGGLVDCHPLGKIDFPKPKNVQLFGPRHLSLKDKVMAMLDDSPQEVVSAGFGWDTDREVMKRLRQLSRRGTDVAMAVSSTTSAHGAMETTRDGIRVAGFSEFCAKALVADSRALVTVKAKMESGDAFEPGLFLDGKRAADVKRTLVEWTKNPRYEQGWKGVIRTGSSRRSGRN